MADKKQDKKPQDKKQEKKPKKGQAEAVVVEESSSEPAPPARLSV